LSDDWIEEKEQPMNFATRRVFLSAMLTCVAVPATGVSVMAAPPEAPPVSKIARADDLVSQVDYYLGDLEKALKSEDEYKDSEEKIVRHGNTLILISLALGLHDKENKYKAAAPAMVKASQELAAAKDYAAAKAGVAAIKAAMSSKGDPSELKWGDIADLAALMKQVPLINNRLKRYLRGSRFKSSAEETAGQSAVIAIIAQGSMASVGKTEKPDETDKWYAFCEGMRDTAVALNASIHAQDEAAKDKALGALGESCHTCHEVFKPDAKIEE
jgi:cytochrome c556